MGDAPQTQADARNGEGRARAAGAPPRSPSPLAYGSAQYHAMSQAVLDCVREAAGRLDAGTVDAASALSSVADGLVAIQTEFFSPQKETGGSRRTRCKTLTPTTLRHRKPHGPFRRLASGMQVPSAVEAQLATHRRLVSDCCRAKQELKRAGRGISAETRVQLEQRAANARAQATSILREVREKLHKHNDRRQEGEAESLAHMAYSNSHRFYRTLANKVPEQYGVFDDSAGPSAEKCAAFRDFFAELLAKLRENAGGEPNDVVEKYDARFPLTNAATHAMLTAVVTWQEVYALLYPAHKLALRPAPCLPECKLCPLFAEHVSSFKPGDTRTTPPEHRPRLWTSKAAGPDGVFAETLRWACPEAREDRHAYRQAVCESLASIFNAVIASGQVPECPQFADSVMTALYKGDGDREAPTNYRGICVPNVLAKLFGLVLGTRLSHWAVVNGVISPAQAGFVVMHGCEYHIFTLLETLRHRARQGQDTFLVFLDFKKAYDSVSQPLAWAVLERMGIPSEFMTLLKSWTAQSRIALRMGGTTLEPFPQETGVPQGGGAIPGHLQSLH